MHTTTPTKVRGIITLVAILVGLGVAYPNAAQAAGPCKVNGYTFHATLRMQRRDIDRADVVNAVRVNCARGKRQSNGTWIYKGSSFDTPKGPVVVLNGNGWVVSTWWPNGFGGGGGGSWRTDPSAVSYMRMSASA